MTTDANAIRNEKGQTLADIYTREWFEHDFAELGPEFEIVADAIVREFKPIKVADVGCGPGQLLEALFARMAQEPARILGIEGSEHAEAVPVAARILGIEGSEHAKAVPVAPVVQRQIRVADIRGRIARGLLRYHYPSLVICTEVLEHIEEPFAEQVVATLCAPLAPILVTAAPPGQDGHYHVNCQPAGYWIARFEACGAHFDDAATARMQRRWSGLQRLSHMARNVMVFR